MGSPPRAAEANRARSQPPEHPFKGIRRNDPCPCGSGKKFKKCCLVTLLGSISPELTPAGQGRRAPG
ncbi:MAG: SEC-C metal-binding domain-containing protein [Stellaceae bacterium]